MAHPTLPSQQPHDKSLRRKQSKRPVVPVLLSNTKASNDTTRPISLPTRSSTRLSQTNKKSSSPDMASSQAPLPTRSIDRFPRSQRPLPAELQVTLTPTTRRPSRALKGKRVHNCPLCEKVFSRKEHLERHKPNHNLIPKFPCSVPGCNKRFQRQDLLNRHLDKGDSGHQRLFNQIVRDKSRFRNSSLEPPLGSMYQYPMTGPYSSMYSAPSLASVMTAAHSHAPITTSMYSVSQAALSQEQFTLPKDPAHVYPFEFGVQPNMTANPFPPPLSYTRSEASGPPSPLSQEYSQIFFPSQLTAVPPISCATSPLPLPLSLTPNWSLSKSPISDIPSFATAWTLDCPLSFPSHLSNITFPDSTLLGMEISDAAPLLPTSDLRYVLENMDHVHLDELRQLFLRASEMDQDILSPANINHLETLLGLYWEYFDPKFPIVHRSTLLRRESNPLLIVAMATLGAYFGSLDARNFATSAHQNTKALLATRDPNSSAFRTSDMQATILVELFAEFRSRRIDVEPSAQFKTLYTRLCGSSRLVSSSRPLSSGSQEDWYGWLDIESQRRMLLVSFQIDAQQAFLFESDMIRPRILDEIDMLLPCSDTLWNCSTSADWSVVTPTDTSEVPATLRTLASRFTVPFHTHLALTPFMSTLVTSFFAIQQSRSKVVSTLSALSAPISTNTFAHTCMALSLTPLRSLLAVVSSTWVFGRKITDEGVFARTKTELRAWTKNRARSQQAAWHASKVIRTALADESAGLGGNLQDSWCLYICSLICWAFVYGLQKPDLDNHVPTTTTVSEEQACQAFLGTLNAAKWETVPEIPRRWQAFAMVRWVRRQINDTSNGLMLEAYEILGKLGEGSRGELF